MLRLSYTGLDFSMSCHLVSFITLHNFTSLLVLFEFLLILMCMHVCRVYVHINTFL